MVPDLDREFPRVCMLDNMRSRREPNHGLSVVEGEQKARTGSLRRLNSDDVGQDLLEDYVPLSHCHLGKPDQSMYPPCFEVPECHVGALDASFMLTMALASNVP